MTMHMHPSDERLRRFESDELTGSGRRRLAEHLEGCSTCRRELAWIRDARAAAGEVTAAGVPATAWERIMERQAAGEQVVLPAAGRDVPKSSATNGPLPRRHWARAAAILLVVVGGVASATISGLPVREWLRRETQDAPVAAADAGDRRPAAAPADAMPATAMSIESDGGSVSIVVRNPDPGVRVRIRLSQASRARLEVRGGAAGALLRTGPGRMEIVDAGAGDILIDLPETLPHATLTVNGAAYLRKEGGTIRILAPGADTTDTEFIFDDVH